ncbi:MAG: carbohydrate kinase family protein [Candidatus Campbellbacteria bacterium]|nr:carbohydrate kinase family protein [Candidatus Campbellbacteria bacterium]
MEKFDFIGIGDITTDAFILLQDAEVNCGMDKESCTISMRWGDKIPFERAVEVPAVGNSVNASFSARRLGLKSAILTNVGDDKNGRVCIDALNNENVDTSLVEIHKEKVTNYHYVLSFGAERTILIKHEHFDYSLPSFEPPKFIYLSSLAENSLVFHKEIVNYLSENPEVKLAFQPGTFQISLGYDALQGIYEHTEVFFCNVEEAMRILKMEKREDIKTILREMHKRGPKIAVITDGIQGAYVHDGNDFIHMPPYPDPKPPVERTGAGDSFSSTFTSYLALGHTIQEAIMRAPINSMSVVQHIGAREGLLTKENIEQLLKNAPSDYNISII